MTISKVDNKKRKTKKANRLGFTMVLLFISAILYLVSCLFLKTLNNNLSNTMGQINEQIADIQRQNDALSVEIEELASAERIYEIAAAEGIGSQPENIITIADGDTAGEE